MIMAGPSRSLGAQSRFRIPYLAELGRPRLAPEQRVRLRVLALSAKAAALAARMETLAERRGSAVFDQDAFDRTDAEIRSIAAELAIIERDEGARDPQNVNLAVAVVENAIGRALHLKSRHADAIRSFEIAAHRVPSMPDPHIGIAAALLRLRGGGPRDWRERAEAELRCALRLSPRNGKASYYLAKLRVEQGRWSDALDCLGSADRHPWALYYQAVLLGLKVTPPDPQAALARMEESIAVLPRPDVRYYEYGDIVLQAPPGTVTAAQVERAIGLAAELADAEPAGDLHDRTLRLRTALQNLLKKDPGGAPSDIPQVD